MEMSDKATAQHMPFTVMLEKCGCLVQFIHHLCFTLRDQECVDEHWRWVLPPPPGHHCESLPRRVSPGGSLWQHPHHLGPSRLPAQGNTLTALPYGETGVSPNPLYQSLEPCVSVFSLNPFCQSSTSQFSAPLNSASLFLFIKPFFASLFLLEPFFYQPLPLPSTLFVSPPLP